LAVAIYCSQLMLLGPTVCSSESEDGIDVSLDMSFNKPVNVSLLRETLFLSLTNLSFAVDLSSFTVTRK